MPVRSDHIIFRVTALERERIRHAASGHGFTKVSPFIRAVLSPLISGKKVRSQVIDRRGLTQLYVELGRANANLRDVVTASMHAENDNLRLVEAAQKQMKDIDQATRKLLRLIA